MSAIPPSARPATTGPLIVALGILGFVVGAALTATQGGGEGGDIRVVETGFSVVSPAPIVTGDTSREDTGEQPAISWGIVLENSRDETAYDTRLTVEFLDEDGEIVDEAQARVAVLQPGQRVGVGSFLDPVSNVDITEVPEGTGTSVVEHPIPDSMTMRAEVGEPAEWRSADQDLDDPQLAVSDLTVTYGPHNQPFLSFTATSGHDERMSDVSVDVIFRDARGDIVGGAEGSLLAPLFVGLQLEPDEETEVELIAPSAIPDLATAEVYVAPSEV